MENKNTFDKKREHSWNEAFYAYGTAYIFEKRAYKLRWRLRILTFLGIAVPLALGGAVASFGLNCKYLGIIIFITGVLGIMQLIGSTWALVAKWEDEYAYSLESISSNYSLSDKYKELGESPPRSDEFRIKIDLLDAENRIRKESDLKHGITDKEKRMGHRAALRQFRRACVECKEIPTSMKGSNCNVCGNFNKKEKK
jgi:mobilome CxxCx(11)CxxC protein